MIRTLALLLLFSMLELSRQNEDAKRLYDDLLVRYNRHKRPVSNPHDALTIYVRLRLSQIIDVHEIDQIMTCSVWVEQVWQDAKLKWDPQEYNGVSVLYIPYEMIWVPDLVLYNNADSNYNITISTKATVQHTGLVRWEPPAIFKSLCQIDVRWFPFDDQLCTLKFGSWTHTMKEIVLEFYEPSGAMTIQEDSNGRKNITLEEGVDLSDYYPSVEWDILSRPAKRSISFYATCCADKGFTDIVYTLELRRKPLFYTVNLVFPCVGISFLTILVFYLPSDSGEKVTLCISILAALTFFFLLLTEIIPATSLTLPLIGNYLLFTMIMVALSVVITVICLNLHWRTPNTHHMPRWVRQVFLKTLPRYLCMRRPIAVDDESFRRITVRTHTHIGPATLNGKVALHYAEGVKRLEKDKLHSIYHSEQVNKAFENICFVAALLKEKDKDDKIDEDWKYVAMVLDRLFLIIYSFACFVGTILILLQAPSLYDNRVAVQTTSPFNATKASPRIGNTL